MKHILPNWANWIARDKNGTLVVFEEEPRKGIKEWADNDGDFLEIEDESGKYMFIKWEDERPYKIHTISEVEHDSLKTEDVKTFEVTIYMNNGRFIEFDIEKEGETADVLRYFSNMYDAGKESGKMFEMLFPDSEKWGFVVPIANISHFEIKES